MSQYFLAGNVWLAFAVLAYLGQKQERSHPTMYSFFGAGQWLSPEHYYGLLAGLIAAGIWCLVLHGRSCRHHVIQK